MIPKCRLYRVPKVLFLIFYLLSISIRCSCNRNPQDNSTSRTKHTKGKLTTSSVSSSSSSIVSSSSFSSSSVSTLPRYATVSQGIPNLGNTCYMNASVQAFTAFYRDLENPKNFSSFNKAAKDLITTLVDSAADQTTLKIEAENFFNSFSSVGLNFSKGKQQDASEVLLKLLDNLGAPQAKTNSRLTNKGTGESRTSAPIPWSMYNLPLQKSDGDKQSLQDVFQRSLKDEPVEMEWNGTYVKEGITRSYKIDAEELKKLNVVPIHIGRFANDTSAPSKVSTELVNPFELVMKKEYLDNANGDLSYELCGFIEHKGRELTGGHYVTYVKEEEKWILYNDSNVSEASQASVEKAASNAYILFYKPKE